jgi:hypothetical protein
MLFSLIFNPAYGVALVSGFLAFGIIFLPVILLFVLIGIMISLIMGK